MTLFHVVLHYVTNLVLKAFLKLGTRLTMSTMTRCVILIVYCSLVSSKVRIRGV